MNFLLTVTAVESYKEKGTRKVVPGSSAGEASARQTGHYPPASKDANEGDQRFSD